MRFWKFTFSKLNLQEFLQTLLLVKFDKCLFDYQIEDGNKRQWWFSQCQRALGLMLRLTRNGWLVNRRLFRTLRALLDVYRILLQVCGNYLWVLWSERGIVDYSESSWISVLCTAIFTFCCYAFAIIFFRSGCTKPSLLLYFKSTLKVRSVRKVYIRTKLLWQ